MHHTKTLGHAIVLSMALASTAASAATAEAWIDWSSLEITLVDLDPSDGVAASLTWTDQFSTTYLDAATFISIDSSDWTSPLDSTIPGASVHLGASTLSASINSAAISTPTDAAALRFGSFTLGANTQVTISATVSAALTPGLAGSYAGAYFELFEEDADQSDLYDTAGIELGDGYLSVASATGLISVSIANASNSAIDAGLAASADTSLMPSPVPEPESYALFLAGLGLMGLVARRRRR